MQVQKFVVQRSMKEWKEQYRTNLGFYVNSLKYIDRMMITLNYKICL